MHEKPMKCLRLWKTYETGFVVKLNVWKTHEKKQLNLPPENQSQPQISPSRPQHPTPPNNPHDRIPTRTRLTPPATQKEATQPQWSQSNPIPRWCPQMTPTTRLPPTPSGNRQLPKHIALYHPIRGRPQLRAAPRWKGTPPSADFDSSNTH